MNKIFQIALCQTKCTLNKTQTLQYVRQALVKAANHGSKMCFLGEVFNSPYTSKYFIQNAQYFQKSPTLQLIRQIAKQHKMYIMGSIPQRQNQKKIFNTAFAINSTGNMIAKFRKVHLFDINIPGKIQFKQSDTFDRGNQICVFDTEYCRVGMAICYDIRFPQLSLLMAKKGAKIIFYPGSFNMTTGPLHWELLLRSRALDNQVYSLGVSTARYVQNPNLYQAWGGSTLVDPFGKVITKAQGDPTILYSDVDMDYVEQVRKQIPVWFQRRQDIYQLKQTQSKQSK